jgi:hypothetical protein
MAYLILGQSKVLTRCGQECMGKLPIITGLPRAPILGSLGTKESGALSV